MRRPHITALAWIGLACGLAICSPNAVVAQSTGIDTELRRVSSPDYKVSSKAFYGLLRPYVNTDDVPGLVRDLLRAHPQQAEHIKLALIKALENMNGYKEQEEDKGNFLDDEFSDYWPDLIWAVGSLRDPRAVRALLGAQGTGGIAANDLADLCPFAVDALIEESHKPDRYFRGEPISDRTAALRELGFCITRVALMRAHPEAVAKIRAAFLTALDDPDGPTRAWAVEGLSYFRNDPDIRARLQALALADPYVGTVARSGKLQEEFVVREAAKRALAPENSEKSYVSRQPSSGECRVQPASEQPVGETLIGPVYDANFQMCTHYDPNHKDPFSCWSFYPPTTCVQQDPRTEPK